MNMKVKQFAAVSLLVVVGVCVDSSEAQEKLRPLRAQIPPVIDGKLDDPIWQQCPSVTNFKTFAPDFGHNGSQKTIAYMAYDNENIYFAFRCFDTEPEKIKCAVSARDNVGADDWVCINLDSFNDQQSLYALYVNPAGIQMDSRFAAGKEDFSIDVVWYSAGQMDAEGYTVELRIPLRSIRYSETNPVMMSVFFERYISRLSEHSSYPELDAAKGDNYLTQMTPLVYPDVKHFTLFEILPAFTYNQKYVLDAGKLGVNEQKGNFSLTSKFGLTSDLILDGTYNPDFSQIESDAGQVDVNLRYALFYSEKRPFFLEGNDIYNIAAMQTSDIDPVVSILHTRTIVNPLLGIKLSGKVDAQNTIASIYAIDRIAPEETSEFGEYAYFPILRYKHALTEDSYMGAIYTGREVKDHYNRVLGADGMLRVTQSSLFQFNALTSATKVDAASNQMMGHSLAAKYSSSTRDLEFYLSVNDVSPEFSTESGYTTRTGVLGIAGFMRPKFYSQSGFFQRIAIDFFTGQTKDLFSNMWETLDYVALRPFFLGSMNGTVLYAYSTEIFDGERFETGGLQGALNGLFTKKLKGSLSLRTGKAIYYSSTPYQGRSSSVSASLTYEPTPNINANVSLVFSNFYKSATSERIYEYPITRGRIIYQLNKYLFLRGIAEYNQYRRRLLTDFLASFTYVPGTVAFVGYGSVYERIEWDGLNNRYVNNNQFLESQRGFFFKMSYLWRM
jgi:hypothetical protein